jgi:hypothetical protein
VQHYLALALAELVKLHTVRVIALVFGSSIVAFFATGAGEMNDYSICFLSHLSFPISSKYAKKFGAFCSPQLSRMIITQPQFFVESHPLGNRALQRIIFLTSKFKATEGKAPNQSIC